MTSNNEPTFLDMNDLCDDSLEALIQHYLSLKHKMPDSVTVRERLLELEREQFNREKSSTIEGVIRQNTDNPIQPMSEDKEKYSGDLYGYEVMLRVLDEETWIVDVRDEVTDEYVDGYEFENYDEAVTEYKLQVNHLCNNKEPKLCNDLN